MNVDTHGTSDLSSTDQHAPQMKGKGGALTGHGESAVLLRAWAQSLRPPDPSGSHLTWVPVLIRVIGARILTAWSCSTSTSTWS